MSGPLTLVAGTSGRPDPAGVRPALSVSPDGNGGLNPTFDEPRLAALVASKMRVDNRAASTARWSSSRATDRPVVPSVDGLAVDDAPLPGRVVAAISGATDRTVVTHRGDRRSSRRRTPRRRASPISSSTSSHRSHRTTPPARTTSSSRPHQRHVRPAGSTFSLNGILGERTEDKGYADGTVIIDGRLTRGTGGGISQVSTVIYNLAYFAGADFLEFSPHAFFIPRYPEGREATVYWPTIDNRWKNDTPYGMLLQTWVEGGNVHGRVWSTKTWDITSVKGPRRNVMPPKTIRDSSPTRATRSSQSPAST